MSSEPWNEGFEGGSSPNSDDIEEAIARYIDALTAGQPLDRMQVLLENPGIGHEILSRLDNFIELEAEANVQQEPLGTLGDYTLRRQIGRGGMGVVYEAWENSLDRRVALKVLPPGIAADTRSSTRFLREAQIAARLSHPQIVPVHATGIKDSTPWYAMEYVEGETLAQILAKLKEAEAEAETVFGKKDCAGYFENLSRCFADVADGLQHAHSKDYTSYYTSFAF